MKTMPTITKMPKRLLQLSVLSAVIMGVAGVLAIVLAVGYLGKPDADLALATASTSSVSRSTDTANPADAIVNRGEPITKVGIVTCLTPKNDKGTQPASCALGVYSNDGKYYGLNSEDSILIGDLASGQSIQVTGFLQKPDTPFDITGVIYVTDLRKLNL